MSHNKENAPARFSRTVARAQPLSAACCNRRWRRGICFYPYAFKRQVDTRYLGNYLNNGSLRKSTNYFIRLFIYY